MGFQRCNIQGYIDICIHVGIGFLSKNRKVSLTSLIKKNLKTCLSFDGKGVGKKTKCQRFERSSLFTASTLAYMLWLWLWLWSFFAFGALPSKKQKKQQTKKKILITLFHKSFSLSFLSLSLSFFLSFFPPKQAVFIRILMTQKNTWLTQPTKIFPL